MKAKVVAALPADGDWLLELKHDGFRCVAVKDGSSIELFSRSRRNMTVEFPEVARAVAALPHKRLVLDGEIVALDQQGHGSFQLLQNRRTHQQESGAIVFYVFDAQF
jgi:bifunctional non-homologous end joining protein LigD